MLVEIVRKQKKLEYCLRVLGLDYGDKRIGLAVCDEMGLTAQGLPTLIRKTKKHDLDTLEATIRKYSVEAVLIGYPLRLDGTEGIQCEKVNRFAALIEKTFLLPVIKWPETMSTKEAEEILISSGVRWQKRKEKVDQLAACLILQNYLDCSDKPKIEQS
jgi:putative pre-16S rRNA nuclease